MIQVFTSPGSPVDIYARIVARLMAPDLGQAVVVENRPGGSGIPMINAMVRAPADGHLIAATTVTLATLFGEKEVAFKPADLQMIARSQIDPFAIVVHTSTPFRNVRQLVEFARKKPGYVNLGGPLAMSSHRVAFEMFAETAGFKATWIPYQGGGQVLTAISGGQVDAAHTNPGNAKPLIDAKRIRMLAVSSEKRLSDFPDIATYRESGWDFVRYNWRGLVARSGMPAATLDRLSGAIEKVHKSAEWKKYLIETAQIDGYLGPEAANKLLALEIADAQRVKARLGIDSR
ncbi:MAG: tripartite tricarboxylate transporter substrate binding protein [bacterium]|nr:tripartite tricarboxylate transporter substrate binding protein [Betaproteobacteria bacterium]